MMNLMTILALNMNTPTCKWCERTVHLEECYADMVVDGQDIKWICGCGIDVTGRECRVSNGKEDGQYSRTEKSIV